VAGDGRLEPLPRECCGRIERDAPPDEREDLQVVTNFFAGPKYNDPRLFPMGEGRKGMPKAEPQAAKPKPLL
jgi:hypothetical protein